MALGLSDGLNASKGMSMKQISTLVLGGAGFLYGLAAVMMVYADAPLELRAFIVGGVAVTGAGMG